MGPERYEATDDEKRLVADIAASLETAMSAEPSADFLARVRGRVAEERDRAATRRSGASGSRLCRRSWSRPSTPWRRFRN
jgi:hypothetical protein